MNHVPPAQSDRQGYGTDNQSTVTLCWMDRIAKQEGLCVHHAFNGREQRVEGVKMDGLAEDGTVLRFHGCFLHCHEACYPQRTTINPVSGLTIQELRDKRHLKTDMLRSKGHVMIEKYEGEFRKDVEVDEQL